MISDWEKVVLSDLVEISHGFAYKGKHFSDDPTEDILVTPGNFQIGGGFKKNKLKYYDGPIEDDYLLQEGDLIVTMTDLSKKADTLGYSALVPLDENTYHHNQRIGLVLIKDSEKIDKHFLYFLFRSPKYRHHVVSRATGSTVKHTSPTKICSFEFELPPINVQKSIASQLMNIEMKFNLNYQTNETLEVMAQAIFKSWFVDFDPVRAKIEAASAGRDPNRAALVAIAGISSFAKASEDKFSSRNWNEIEAALDQKLARMSEAQQQQLTRTAELFPDELVESEIGEVPKGWGISEIGKEVNSVGGTTPRTKNPEYWDGGKIAWTTPKDLSDANSKILLETNRKITDEGLDQISSGLLPIDTVLMSSRAPVGYLALSKIPVAINQGYIAMICDQILTAEYVLHWTESSMDMIKQHAGGSTFSEISKRNFRPLPVLVPSESVLKAYSEKAGALYDLITANMKENKTLENLRDTLLPKLISGEIKVN